jgi:probable DNA metabolism protein
MVEVKTGSVVLLHDGSFEGFLTVVFEATRSKLDVRRIESASRFAGGLFDAAREIETEPELAARVWSGLRKHGEDVASMVHGAFLSEIDGIDSVIWRYLRRLFSGSPNAHAKNVLDPDVLAVYAAAQKTRHEAHLFLGFVRFAKAPDGSMFSVIAPDHNILQIIASHFLSRYPNRQWMIADAKRGLCLVSDASGARVVECDPARLPKDARAAARLADPEEDKFRDLWSVYYDAVNIAARKNTRLMARLLPRKYWRYLPERQPKAP